MPLSLRYVAHSEIGLVRKNNQDSGYASPTMLFVADGMGGAAAGDLASTVAIHTLQQADGHYEGEQMLDVLAETLAGANDLLADLVVEDHALEGMGTTVCGGLFDGAQLGIAHIGDSRGYIVRDDQLTRLTRDHSWVQQLIDEGRISEEEALTHPHRSLILRVLNGQPVIEPDFDLIDLLDGDRLLFCSDGLCGLVDDEQIAVALQNPNIDQVLEILVNAAHNGGGLDNITIIIADVVSEELTPLQPVVLGAALTREIPPIGHAPIDLSGKDDPEDTQRLDEAGNPLPPAPPPVDADAQEEARYHPTVERQKKRWFRFLLALIIPVVAFAAGIAVWYGYTRNLYFVGADDGVITVYRGVPEQVGPWPLFSEYEKRETQVTDLPPVWAEKVRARQFPTGTLEEARQTASELDRFAQDCIRTREQRARETATTPPPTPTASTGTPPASVTSSATVTATGTETNPTEGC